MRINSQWTVDGLAAQVAASDVVAQGVLSIEMIDVGAQVLEFIMHEYGDLAILLSVEGQQILASVVLCAADNITDRDAFERVILKTHKMIPLSTFGIVEIDGSDHFELFGSLSASSRFEVVMEEVETLARNAIEAARLIADWSQSSAMNRPTGA